MVTQRKTIGLVVTGSCNDRESTLTVINHIQSVWHCDVVADVDFLTVPTSPELRAQRLLAVMQNDAVDFIWIMRGGEGSADMIPYLHQQAGVIESITPKPMMGLSDATAVLIYLQQQFQWPTTYGIGALLLAKLDQFDADSVELVRCFITEQSCAIALNDLQPLNQHALEQQTIEANLCVGNMSLMAISIADLWQFDARDKILILEDWNERGYVIDRTLKYFQRIGQLDGVKALILGDFSAAPFSSDRVEQEHQQAYLNKVLKRFAGRCNFPVMTTRYVGHGYHQTPMPMGITVKLHCGLKPQLRVCSS
ncbi:MAG: LD-carboxypeptidase [Coxiellaceae bacterium]|nr:LD-carboxypeptidase [Coxiellaceae bacterium]